jgi:hypothetical protein
MMLDQVKKRRCVLSRVPHSLYFHSACTTKCQIVGKWRIFYRSDNNTLGGEQYADVTQSRVRIHEVFQNIVESNTVEKIYRQFHSR